MSKQYTDQITKAAKAVWDVMHREASNRGMALQREKQLGDGRIIINTVGAFIKGLNRERDWGLDQNQVDLVRRYLKNTGNVVVLSKVEQYKFRIFIREEWSEAQLVVEPTVKRSGPSPEERLRPEEAGEDRDPAPVEYKCGECGEVYPSQNALNGHMGGHSRKSSQPTLDERGDGRFSPISEPMAQILLVLEAHGGTYTTENGLMASKISEEAGIPVRTFTGSMGSLAQRGYVTRKGKGKRTYRLWLTPEGRSVLDNLNVYRKPRHALADLLKAVGRIEREDRRSLYETISHRMGISAHRVSSGLHELEDEGLVVIERPSAKAFPTAVIWTGARLWKDEEVAKSEPEETTRVWQQSQEALDDERLLTELAERLRSRGDTSQIEAERDELQQRLDLVADIVEEVNEGKITPLKGLGEVQDALSL